jgi:multidrug efflux system outer membrane protein
MNKIFMIISALATLLAGCTMVPKYERPPAPVSDVWPLQAHQDLLATNANIADIPWNLFFDDPRLQQLISLSLEHNRDLRAAALRVEETRALYRIQRAELFPALDLGASAARQRTPSTVSITGDARTFTTYDVSVGAAFELDLFGRIRSLKEEALQRFFASDANRRTVQIALISEVATQYLTFLQLQEAFRLAEQTLEAVQTSFNLNQRSFQAGVASELDLRTAEAQVQAAQVNLSTFHQLLSQAQNALVLLVGQPIPDNLPPGKPLHQQRLLNDLPVGLPSDLLHRRPDILAAEHSLLAANANIGAARAAFFPRILLTGSGGTMSANLSDLFTGPSAAWSFAPQIAVPIFQGGRNRANLDAAQVRKQIEIANYERAIQVAFREVADALAVRAFVDEKVAAQQRLVQAQQRRFELTNARYRQGVDNYVEVLLAQQDLYAAQQNLLQFQAARLVNVVTLYRTLGGGWNS